MKKLPSIGFLYLLMIIGIFVFFITWIEKDSWYDRIFTGSQTNSDLGKWAVYLEKTSKDFSGDKKVQILKEASQLRNQLGQHDKALDNLQVALKIKPDDVSLKALLPLLYWEKGFKEKAVKIAKEDLENEDTPINSGTVTVLLNFLADHKDPDLATRLARIVNEIDIPGKKVFKEGRIVSSGFTADGWTLNGKPAFLFIKRQLDPLDNQSNFLFKLSCFADSQYTPIVATIENQEGEVVFSYVFRTPEQVEFKLPANTDTDKVFFIKTDKFWIPSKDDPRRLGVLVEPAA